MLCNDRNIYNSACLFVCSFAIRVKTTGQDYKVGLQKCPPWVEIARLAVLEELSIKFCFFACS